MDNPRLTFTPTKFLSAVASECKLTQLSGGAIILSTAYVLLYKIPPYA